MVLLDILCKKMIVKRCQKPSVQMANTSKITSYQTSLYPNGATSD